MTTTNVSPGNSELVRRVAELSGQNVFACYQCGKCTAGCPFGFDPQGVLRRIQLGEVETAIGLDTPWDCAACLTCAANCPKGVDPTKVYQALRSIAETDHVGAHHRRHRLRTTVLANNHRTARLGSHLAPCSNWAFCAPGAGVALERVLGVHHARSLPPFARPTFQHWFRDHVPLRDGHRGKVLLFHDTFMDFNFPETGVAATELLELAGYQVELTNAVCCGRVLISKGHRPQAARHAQTNIPRLYEQSAQAAAIVGCEPSCLLTLRHEYPDLAGDDDTRQMAKVVASRCLLLDEFLERLADDGQLELNFREPPAKRQSVLFHGHCHQKAMAKPLASVRLLRLAGYDAELINAACCGMAGSFGYEKEHYEASRAALEQGVAPALRAQPEAPVVVMGVSCRQQIEHFCGRQVRHLAQALREAVAEEPADPTAQPAGRTEDPASVTQAAMTTKSRS
ncbi:MAG TPA: heterodisulfide reductase-related iron-sulfur binding cluster [Streptosporangiaceae bacterium]|nr:heterodisulfide reductase-related iron-sulfur binding cluster [Streptosporangiaceae bacterium]